MHLCTFVNISFTVLLDQFLRLFSTNASMDILDFRQLLYLCSMTTLDLALMFVLDQMAAHGLSIPLIPNPRLYCGRPDARGEPKAACCVVMATPHPSWKRVLIGIALFVLHCSDNERCCSRPVGMVYCVLAQAEQQPVL